MKRTRDSLSVRGAATAEQTREMNTRSLSVRAASIDEKTRSVEAVLSTETPAEIIDWFRMDEVTEILVASGARFAPMLPMLDNHNRFEMRDQIGSVREIHLDGNRIVGRLYFAEGLEKAEAAWQLVRQGHADSVSIGYRVDDNGYVDIAPGATAEVNGKSYTAPAGSGLRVSYAWELKELSVVHIGADPNARIREAKRTASTQHKEHTMDEFRNYLESLGLKKGASEAEAMAFYRTLGGEQFRAAKEHFDKLDEPARKALGEAKRAEDVKPEDEKTPGAKAEADPDAETEDEEDKPMPEGTKASKAKTTKRRAAPVDSDVIRKAERERITRLRSLDDAGNQAVAELVERGVNENWTYEQTATAVLQAERRSLAPAVNAAPAGHVRSNDPVPNALAASILMRSGMRFDQLPVDRTLVGDARRGAQARLASEADRFKHYGLVDIVQDCLGPRGGRHLSSQDAVREIIGMEHARQVGHYSQRGATGTFSGIFSTVFDVQLMAHYDAYEDTTRQWVVERDVPNFQTVDRVLAGKGGALKKLSRGDTAKDDTMGDDKESYKIARYAKKFVVDEQDIIDDRVEILTDYPREAGEAAAQLRPDGVYYILLANPTLDTDGVALFNSAHGGNTTTGALTITTLEASRGIMAKQTQNGRTLNLSPKFLAGPQDLWGTIMQLLNSTQLLSTVATSAGGGFFGTDNYIRSLGLKPIIDNRLGVAGVTDPVTGTAQAGTATNYFLIGDRNTIEVGYLRGTGRRPQIRSFVLDQGQWGLGWDVNMDIGFKALDYRALVFSTGDA